MAMQTRRIPIVGDSAVIVLLAAGEGRRYGSPKQLAVIDGEPMLRRVARTALGAGVPVFVVLGAQADAVRSALDGLSVTIVHCADWVGGMGRSLAAGAAAVEKAFPTASGLLLCLADQPLIEVQMFAQLLRRHRDVPQKILVSRHDDAIGPPVIFPRDCLAELAQWSGTGGARALLQRESHRVERCLVDVGIDVDTPAALIHVNRLLAARKAPAPD
jgi:molybdenum cofactor cytidylyltransferase